MESGGIFLVVVFGLVLVAGIAMNRPKKNKEEKKDE